MINSIQHFQEKGIKNLTEVFSNYTDDPAKFAEMVYEVTKEVTKLVLSMIEGISGCKKLIGFSRGHGLFSALWPRLSCLRQQQ